LVAGGATPWKRRSGADTATSELDDSTLRSVANSRRRSPYLALAGMLAVITLLSISYPYFRDTIYDASKGRSPSAPSTNTSAARDGVMSTLNGWTAATNARNLNNHMSFYCDNLSVYYGRKNVGKDVVRANRAPAFTKYTSLKVELNNVQISMAASGNTAVATFDKVWDFGGARHSTGSSQQFIWLSRINGRWLITGEKDLKVYYANW
jgi:ketosteroid isomerase-like protein